MCGLIIKSQHFFKCTVITTSKFCLFFIHSLTSSLKYKMPVKPINYLVEWQFEKRKHNWTANWQHRLCYFVLFWVIANSWCVGVIAVPGTSKLTTKLNWWWCTLPSMIGQRRFVSVFAKQTPVVFTKTAIESENGADRQLWRKLARICSKISMDMVCLLDASWVMTFKMTVLHQKAQRCLANRQKLTVALLLFITCITRPHCHFELTFAFTLNRKTV